MTILHCPLLGVAFVAGTLFHILGTLVSGAICVLLALTQGWLIAVIVLAYFVRLFLYC